MTNKVEKKLYISLLSVIATISVVMIHTNNTTVWIYKDVDYWVKQRVIRTLKISGRS